MSENHKPNGQGTSGDETTAISEAPNPLQEAQSLAEKYKNDFLYLKAEFENYKRNVLKERSELLKYGCERLLVEVLNVVDNFERALQTKATSDNFSQYVKGVEMTAGELRSVLQKFGVQEVPSLGQDFDPSLHEAISSEETSQYSPGQVSKVLRKPYRLHEKVIRPAQVLVAKKPAGS